MDEALEQAQATPDNSPDEQIVFSDNTEKTETQPEPVKKEDDIKSLIDEDIETKSDENSEKKTQERPEWLQEKFWTGDFNDSFEKMSKSYNELQDKLYTKINKGKEDKVGKEVSDYATEEFFQNESMKGLEDDPAVKIAFEKARDLGLGIKEAQNFVLGVQEELSKILPPPPDIAQEKKKLGADADHLIKGVKIFLDGSLKSGEITETQYDILRNICTTSDGIKTVEYFMNKSGQYQIPTGPAKVGDQVVSQQEYANMRYETHARPGETREQYNEREQKIAEQIFGTGIKGYNGSGFMPDLNQYTTP